MRLHEEAFRKFDSRSVPRCFRLGLRASDGRVYRQERTHKNRSVNVRKKSDEDQEGPQGRQEKQEGLQHHDHNPASEVTRLHYFSGHEPRAVSARSRGAEAARSFFEAPKIALDILLLRPCSVTRMDVAPGAGRHSRRTRPARERTFQSQK